MSDSASSNPEQADNPPAGTRDYSLLSEHYEDFTEALELLYIPGNLGGRLKFLKQWPQAAQYIFGDELIGFDVEGASDLERRAELEESADERRLRLLEYASDVEAKSVRGGALEKSYIQQVVEAIGRELALCIYAPRVIEKVLPQPAPPATTAPAVAPPVVPSEMPPQPVRAKPAPPTSPSSIPETPLPAVPVTPPPVQETSVPVPPANKIAGPPPPRTKIAGPPPSPKAKIGGPPPPPKARKKPEDDSSAQ